MSTSTTASTRSALLQEAVTSARNPDGGWGYYAGKASRVEPTAWVALSSPEFTEEAIAWLTAAQGADGWVRDDRRAPVNYGFNALALLAMLSGRPAPDGAAALCRGLLAAKGLAFPPSDIIRQDNSLQAWSWVDGTLSWVEPTAYSLLALKRALRRGIVQDPAARQRIDVGERMLADRSCAGGGWNYGNSQVFDKKLLPHGPTTALALLALQDRRDLPAVQSGLHFLAAHAESEPSGLALALTSICLTVFSHEAGTLAHALRERAPASLQMGNVVTLAALRLATSGAPDAMDAFRVGA